MAEQYDLPFLGALPLDPRVGRCCDEGKSFMDVYPDSKTTAIFKDLVARTFAHSELRRQMRPWQPAHGPRASGILEIAAAGTWGRDQSEGGRCLIDHRVPIFVIFVRLYMAMCI